MTEAEIELSKVYMSAFTNKLEWTVEQHVAGLRAVFLAGVNAERKSSQSTEDTK